VPNRLDSEHTIQTQVMPMVDEHHSGAAAQQNGTRPGMRTLHITLLDQSTYTSRE